MQHITALGKNMGYQLFWMNCQLRQLLYGDPAEFQRVPLAAQLVIAPKAAV